MTAITAEIDRFNRLSATWWNSQGPMRPLHVVNALRLNYIVEQIAAHFGRAKDDALTGLRILDVGCGGGLLSEPLARLGAHVLGVDASPGNIAAARRVGLRQDGGEQRRTRWFAFRLHHRPNMEEPHLRHHRNGVCFARVAAWHAPMDPLRAPRGAGHGHRSVRPTSM